MLTHPELAGRFKVTVYQPGWRLGGKGASGRGPDGRIEEHGLHIWMGCYENAFRLMRAAYAELDRDPSRCPIATWRDAFFPTSHVGVARSEPERGWSVWSSLFPGLPGLPGEPLPSGVDNPFSIRGYMVRLSQVMLTLFRTAYGPPTRDPTSTGEPSPQSGSLAREVMRVVEAEIGAGLTLVTLAADRIEVLTRVLRQSPTLSLLEPLVSALAPMLSRLAEHLAIGESARRAAEVLELTLAAAIGIVRDGLLTHPDGFSAIDHLEYREWLRRHGASEAALRAPFLQGLYSLMFAYEGGDVRRPRVAAGHALRGCLRMFFTYRGSYFWKMQAGMGDIVFAPLYEVLRQRGVDFQFFHRLTDVGLSELDAEGKRHVQRLEMDVQATVLGGRAYEPLVNIHGVPSWPSGPDWTQLVDGARLKAEKVEFESFWDERRQGQRTLELGEDFDFVVLGVGLGAIPHVASQIVETDPRWRAMVDNIATVGTQALQLWTRPTMEQLGWDRGEVTMTSFTDPFDTWSDMTHLVDAEAWPSGSRPGAVAYFCHVLDERAIASAGPPGPDYRARIDRLVEMHAGTFTQRDLPHLWPGLAEQPEAVMDRFWTGNVDPSDRYVQCLPGTPQFRISPLDPTYDNLTIAGDWTACGLSVGCVEAAVMSGLLACHALSGFPALSSIVGYDHP